MTATDFTEQMAASLAESLRLRLSSKKREVRVAATEELKRIILAAAERRASPMAPVPVYQPIIHHESPRTPQPWEGWWAGGGTADAPFRPSITLCRS